MTGYPRTNWRWMVWSPAGLRIPNLLQ